MSLFVIYDDLAFILRLLAYTTAITFIVGGLVTLGVYCYLAWERVQSSRTARRKDELQITVAKPGDQIIVSQIGDKWRHQPVHLLESEQWMIHNLLYSTATKVPPQTQQYLLESSAQTQQNILDLLRQDQRLLIYGPSGSGKSSLLRHIVSNKLQDSGKILLCDPHGSRPKWGQHVDAIGFGEQWDEILRVFKWLEMQHKKRIKQIGQGHRERGFPIITVIIEEVQAIVQQLTPKVIGPYMQMFLTRTRKTGIDVIAVTQATTVEALALKNFAQNRDAFAMCQTSGRDGRGHKITYKNEYGDELDFDAPVLWPDTIPVGVTQEKVLELPASFVLEMPVDKDAEWVKLVRSGISKNEASLKVFGRPYGGNLTKLGEKLE